MTLKLPRYGSIGSEQPAALYNGTVFDMMPLTEDIDGEFLATGEISKLREALISGALPAADITGARIGAPIARRSAVVCIGMNYAAHVAESGAEPPEDRVPCSV